MAKPYPVWGYGTKIKPQLMEREPAQNYIKIKIIFTAGRLDDKKIYLFLNNPRVLSFVLLKVLID